MWITFGFSIIYLICIIYMISYRLNIKKAVERSVEAYYPSAHSTLDNILVPDRWEPMIPLDKRSKSYRIVHWGTPALILLMSILFILVFGMDFLHGSFINFGYIFFTFLVMIRHQGNIYLLNDGVILNGRFFSWNKVKGYRVEKIVKWHELYGLDDRLNNSYKVSLLLKRGIFQPNYVVLTEECDMKTAVQLLEDKGIEGAVAYSLPQAEVQR